MILYFIFFFFWYVKESNWQSKGKYGRNKKKRKVSCMIELHIKKKKPNGSDIIYHRDSKFISKGKHSS